MVSERGQSVGRGARHRVPSDRSRWNRVPTKDGERVARTVGRIHPVVGRSGVRVFPVDSKPRASRAWAVYAFSILGISTWATGYGLGTLIAECVREWGW